MIGHGSASFSRATLRISNLKLEVMSFPGKVLWSQGIHMPLSISDVFEL